MNAEISGIHHVTALARDPAANVEFYTRVLGLRMVKKTVNFDDPGTYHLYYGDELGRPGTIMTFFPWPGAAQGRRGAGQATVTAFRVPEGSLGYWAERLDSFAVEHGDSSTRFGREVLSLRDHDGLQLELVAGETRTGFVPWSGSPVPEAHAIRGFHGVTLTETDADATGRFLFETMGFELVSEAGPRLLFQAGPGAEGATLEVVRSPGERRGIISAGTVHHVAWRVPADEAQREWQQRLAARNTDVTQVIDRNYFRSIYFQEPGGVLFEIATDPPGFTVDESPETLGHDLRLPPWYEPHRARIEEALPPLNVGAGTAGD
jgi:glyoxalase family protein